MFTISVPIDDYIDKTFKINDENIIVLPKKINDNKKEINLSFNLEDTENGLDSINGNIVGALSDGFINGFIEGQKEITKRLLDQKYDYEDIEEITGLSLSSIYKIENEI